jgi:hypothetical protein
MKLLVAGLASGLALTAASADAQVRTDMRPIMTVGWPPRPPAPVPGIAPKLPPNGAGPAKPLEANAKAPAAPPSVSPPVLPTEPMPEMQGLE